MSFQRKKLREGASARKRERHLAKLVDSACDLETFYIPDAVDRQWRSTAIYRGYKVIRMKRMTGRNVRPTRPGASSTEI